LSLKFDIKIILLSALVLFACSCGDYNPCDALVERICKECPKVSEHWQAACICMEDNSYKEKGYKCIDPDAIDEDRCHVTLSEWDENTCEQLN